MSATAPARGARARARALLALDGPLAALTLTVFGYFLVSVSFLACLVPVGAISALVGWQPTHLALWAGALSLLPLVPAMYALLRGSRRLLAEREDARAGREFWRSFARATRTLWPAAAGTSAVALLLAYDFALFGDSDTMLLVVVAAATVALAFVIGFCDVAAAQPDQRVRDCVVASARAIARRPHIALSWPLLIGLGVAALWLPLVGPALALFLPAILGVGIRICNDALCLLPKET